MQYSFSALALLAVAGLAAAQIPTCAQPCLDSATKDACGDATDFACACTPANQAKIQNAATTCVLDACGPEVAVRKFSSIVMDEINTNNPQSRFSQLPRLSATTCPLLQPHQHRHRHRQQHLHPLPPLRLQAPQPLLTLPPLTPPLLTLPRPPPLPPWRQ